MEITNLKNNPAILTPKKPLLSLPLILILISLGLASGFWFSRFEKNPLSQSEGIFSSNKNIISSDEIDTASDLEIGKIYGNNGKIYKDIATGVIEKGNINGEGTHILKRDGGDTQRVSLTSSAVDLDLFVGKKVEVKGETNASNKTAWLLDVGTVKVLE